MIEYNDVIIKIYNQKAEIERENKTPYYLCVSKDIYEVIKKELMSSVIRAKYEVKGVIDFFDDMEVVVFVDNNCNNFISVKGLNFNHAK